MSDLSRLKKSNKKGVPGVPMRSINTEEVLLAGTPLGELIASR
jgi:hypothetical protein